LLDSQQPTVDCFLYDFDADLSIATTNPVFFHNAVDKDYRKSSGKAEVVVSLQILDWLQSSKV
jgi:hypothetical protein